MYRAIVAARVRRAWSDLQRHNTDAVLTQFAERFEHSFASIGPPPCGVAVTRCVRPPAGRPGAGGSGIDASRIREDFSVLYRAAYAMCRSRHDAEDLVQDAYLRALRRPRIVRAATDTGYMLRVLRNCWIDRCRRNYPPIPIDSDELEFAVDGARIDLAELVTMYDALHALPLGQRDVVIAVDIVGLSYKETAQALGTPVGTIMSRLYRGREAV